MDRSDLIPFLAVWAVAIGLLLIQTSKRPVAGLVAAYCFQMWLLHWMGALVHSFPWSELPQPEIVLLGFRQATYGIAAFAIGVMAFGTVIGRKLLTYGPLDDDSSGVRDPRTGRLYILAGILSYFVLAPTLGRVSGMQAVSAVGSQLVVVGCCLQCWIVWNKSGTPGLIRTLVPTLLIPLVILMKQGFLGFGVIAVSIILLFTAQFFRPRWVLGIGFVFAAYMGMTVYVSYMRDRIEIRATVWGEQAMGERLQAAWKTVTTLDQFDPKDADQLALVDERLNQNLLIGAAVDNLSRTGDYARGSTFKDALLGMIPRLIWPGKPVGAGSHGLVTSFTGIEFSYGTSVGIGPVLEFYGNFGTVGVLLGFLLLGGVVGGLDFCAGTYLHAGNWPYFMTAFLVGISFMNVSGSLVEITAGATASLVVAWVVRHVIKPRRMATEDSLEHRGQQPFEPAIP